MVGVGTNDDGRKVGRRQHAASRRGGVLLVGAQMFEVNKPPLQPEEKAHALPNPRGTGIKVSPYALGTLMFATSIGNPDRDDSVRVIHKALDAGINLVDTADAYGDSEEIVGQALKGRRDSVVLATKFSRPMGDDPNRQGTSRRWVMTAVEGSLRRLQTDHIDLYQIHRPDPTTDIDETLSALSDLVHSGKVRAIGSSGTPASDIVEAQWVSERRGLERFRTEQPPYSILNRAIEREVLPVTQRYGMGTLVWARWRKACSRGVCARASTTTCAGPACSVISTTSAASTPSNSSSRWRGRQACE